MFEILNYEEILDSYEETKRNIKRNTWFSIWKKID